MPLTLLFRIHNFVHWIKEVSKMNEILLKKLSNLQDNPIPTPSLLFLLQHNILHTVVFFGFVFTL